MSTEVAGHRVDPQPPSTTALEHVTDAAPMDGAPSDGSTPRMRRFLPVGWAFPAMVACYPLWWALGLGAFSWTLFAIPMAVVLFIRPVRLPRGAGLLLLFLLCVLVSAIQIDTPDRLAGYLLRTSYYLAAAVTWLYLVNHEDDISTTRIMRALLWLWAASVAGGFLGLLLTEVSWTGPGAMLIPEGMRNNSLIRDLVTPGFAEVNDIIGMTISRPKAPYTYTNGWGSTMALLTPIAVASSVGPWFSARAKRWIRIGLLLSAVPIIASLNRGLWALILLAVLYVVFRRSPEGRGRTTAIVVLGLLAITTVVATTPIGDPVRDTLDTRSQDSNERRELIYEETFDETLDSPFLGYGAPRPATRTEQSLGSHGQLWTVMFSHGFIAAGLFLAFIGSLAWRSRDPATTAGTWLHVALVVGLVQMLFYGQLPQQLFVIVSIAAVARRMQNADSKLTDASVNVA